jgi:hypothetical protein
VQVSALRPQVEQADALAPQVSMPRGAQVLPEQQPVVQV